MVRSIRWSRRLWLTLGGGLAIIVVGYGGWSQAQRRSPAAPATLRIGFGLVPGVAPDMGLEAQMRVLRSESLITFRNDGRPDPRIADAWEMRPDRLTWSVHLREGATFHDGQPVTADLVVGMLNAQLPSRMGPDFKDVAAIRAVSSHVIEITLRRPLAMLIEWLDVDVYDAVHGGTSPYRRSGEFELSANEHYWGGPSQIERIVFERYPSNRAAWADMLRGRLDMLYEVGPDALSSLTPSTEFALFTVQRRYAYEMQFNVRHPVLRDPEIRRQLNAAIDRTGLVASAFSGHARPEQSPLWPSYWAIGPDLAGVAYAPRPLEHPLTLTCIFPDAGLDRMALAVQQQLAEIGVTLKLEMLSLEEYRRRWLAGDFELAIGDFVRGPTIARLASFWRTDGAYNYGRYSNPAVDRAFDAIRDSSDDAAYRQGVTALDRALVEDPPSIFLVWSERIRAVSTRFDVYQEPGRDVLNTIRQWRLAPPPPRLTH